MFLMALFCTYLLEQNCTCFQDVNLVSQFFNFFCNVSLFRRPLRDFGLSPPFAVPPLIRAPQMLLSSEQFQWHRGVPWVAELDEWGCNRDGSPACFSREMPLQYRSRQRASSRESVIRAISDSIAR